MVREWRVLTEIEHLSDHRYILIRLDASANTVGVEHRPERRWALKKLDEDKLMASVTSALWSKESENQEQEEDDPLKEVKWIIDAMTRACDASMPRAKQRPRRSTYWWNEEIATLRQEATRRSRKVARSKGNTRRRAIALAAYKEIRKSLRTAIKKAKAVAWEELLQTLEEDPWGRPYKLVLNKLRPAAPPLTETLDPEFVERVVTTLFPATNREQEEEEGSGPLSSQDQEWTEDCELGMEELHKAAKRGLKGNTAPGPDGLHKKIWALAMQAMAERIRRLFNACLKKGVFPPAWAKLVLPPAEGQVGPSP